MSRLSDIPGIPRILTADEIRNMHWGHGWVEFRPDPQDPPMVPAEDYLMERVWLGDDVLEQDAYGCVSTGLLSLQGPYGVSWRVWDARPTADQMREAAWDVA